MRQCTEWACAFIRPQIGPMRPSTSVAGADASPTAPARHGGCSHSSRPADCQSICATPGSRGLLRSPHCQQTVQGAESTALLEGVTSVMAFHMSTSSSHQPQPCAHSPEGADEHGGGPWLEKACHVLDAQHMYTMVHQLLSQVHIVLQRVLQQVSRSIKSAEAPGIPLWPSHWRSTSAANKKQAGQHGTVIDAAASGEGIRPYNNPKV